LLGSNPSKALAELRNKISKHPKALRRFTNLPRRLELVFSSKDDNSDRPSADLATLEPRTIVVLPLLNESAEFVCLSTIDPYQGPDNQNIGQKEHDLQ
jgi:hypothetical protein